jgi:ATP-binding cassette subfamily C (CFTR/MRP) protein 4
MFRDFLIGKTCILVTHQLQYVKAAKLIYLLESGTLQTMKTNDEISRFASPFFQFLSNKDNNGEEENNKSDKVSATLITPRNEKVENHETRDYDDKIPLIKKEVCQKGSVAIDTYTGYFKSANCNLFLAIFICLVIIASAVEVFGQLILGKW